MRMKLMFDKSTIPLQQHQLPVLRVQGRGDSLLVIRNLPFSLHALPMTAIVLQLLGYCNILSTVQLLSGMIRFAPGQQC